MIEIDYNVKFRAFGITFGTKSGKEKVNLPNVTSVNIGMLLLPLLSKWDGVLVELDRNGVKLKVSLVPA